MLIKWFALGSALILAGAALGFFYSEKTRNSITHSELFELKRNCAKLAQEFASKQSGAADDGFKTSLKLLYSDYSIGRKSCFAEFDKFAYFPHVPRQNFSEYQIYDLLTGQKIAALTTTDKNPDTSEWSEYFLKAEPEYSDVRREIFGLKR